MPPLAPPDGPTLTGANLKSGIVAELIQLADRLGVDSRLWFEGMRLDNTRFDDEPPVYLSYRQACQIIRRALASLPGQGHGLTVGRAQGVGRFGLHRAFPTSVDRQVDKPAQLTAIRRPHAPTAHRRGQNVGNGLAQMLNPGKGCAGVAIHSDHRGLLREGYEFRVRAQVLKLRIGHCSDASFCYRERTAVRENQRARGENRVAKDPGHLNHRGGFLQIRRNSCAGIIIRCLGHAFSPGKEKPARSGLIEGVG